MTSEILEEVKENMYKIEKLIARQKFSVGDAHTFLARYYNFYRKIEQLEISRDKWKAKYLALQRV